MIEVLVIEDDEQEKCDGDESVSDKNVKNDESPPLMPIDVSFDTLMKLQGD